MLPIIRFPGLIGLCALAWLATVGVAADPPAASSPTLPPAAARSVNFVRDVQPLFAANCYRCHGPDKQEAQFRLDVKESALSGGELGPAILPGKSADSLLIQAVSGLKPDLVMPRKGNRLTTDQVGLLRAWVD